MQSWFSLGSGEDDRKQPQQTTSLSSSSSLLSDWNSYAASKSSEDSGGSLVGVFDLESAVRSANDTVTGTFNVVSKGVRDIPGSLQSATIIVLVPQKFALCFTLGCGLIIGSFFALKGPKNQFEHMLSKERLPFTMGFLGTMVGTIYVSMALHSYILSVLFSVLQVIALAYYVVSYFPGGSTGMKYILSGVSSSIMKCFGR
ncbi:hypothetical protein Vadar_009913 [Vaccinium darrowii]|uniref:Uncharacterized protein n=1 Tax=Vaccinium darrowii TaxID=229202 RepID=A0ACB7Z328_9ERIC|nr:hypothetical protein Vadar_009913 [Vaccinium darrowii]